jgi:hypothetical protein
VAITVGGTKMGIPLPDSSAHSISIDCKRRTVRVDGELAGLTLASDRPVLTPGRKSARVFIGTGMATISWVQRYR